MPHGTLPGQINAKIKIGTVLNGQMNVLLIEVRVFVLYGLLLDPEINSIYMILRLDVLEKG
jgi:hypothetical protein